MSVLKAIILGIVQGVTEFLPVSSSGHLSLFHYLLGTTSDTSLLFDVMLHLGTLIAVFIVYYKTIWALVIEFFKLIKDIFTGKFKFKEITGTRKMLIMFVFSCIPLLFLLIPVGGGQKLMDVCGRFFLGDNPLGRGIQFPVNSCITSHFYIYIKEKETCERGQYNRCVCRRCSSGVCCGFSRAFTFRIDDINRYDVRRKQGVYGSVFVHSWYSCNNCR